MEKKSLAKELLEKYEEIEFFDELSTQSTNSLDIKEVAQLVFGRICTIIGCNIGGFVLFDFQKNQQQSIFKFC